MIAFETITGKFAASIEANDPVGLASLFAPEGIYDDGFFGPHVGLTEIATLMRRFHESGSDFRWEFFDHLSNEDLGYARYRWSYRSRVPGTEGRPAVIEGVGFFRFQDGLISRFSETLDRGMVLAHHDFPAEQIKNVLQMLAETQNSSPECRDHLERFNT